MSQPLWYLRSDDPSHADRVIGPFPAPQVREFLAAGEITLDWLMSLNQVDWLTLRESGQFQADAAPAPTEVGAQRMWREEREHARQRWLQQENDVDTAESRNLAQERRMRQALADDAARTDQLVQRDHARRPPLWLMLLGAIAVLGAGVGVWVGQRGSAIQAGIGQAANCQAVPAANINWESCDKSGLRAPGMQVRNARMRGIKLENADLSGADLAYAVLSGANLRHASLRGAGLSGADLSGADLTGADLSGADLRYAVLSRAVLAGARLQNAQLGKAEMPDGRLCAEGSVGECR